MKKTSLFLVPLLFVVVLSACGKDVINSPDSGNGNSGQNEVKLTLWTFPVGNWGNPTAVTSLLSGFHKEYPNIDVLVEYLTYEQGDTRIDQAIADGNLPDLILEGPERLVANWGDKGLMVDLSDLWDSDRGRLIYENTRQACQHKNGAYYEFPICMSAHCMAINYDMFQAAGALQYIDEETRTWTTEGFIQAVHALTNYGQKQVGVIYCKNQSGDQGTRALVNNLYGGSFTDDTHTFYTIDSPDNIKALQMLYNLEGITFESSISSSEAMDMFCSKELAMCFCWNVSLEIQQTINHPYLDFEIFPMAFPTDTGLPKLQGGIWGFGIFDNGDKEQIAAAKTFIQYMTEDDAQYTRTVRATSHWPVCDLGDIYINDMLMTEYNIFMPYVGDYYQITPGWSQARTAWWQMLQKISVGTDIAEAVKDFPAFHTDAR